MQQGVGIVPSEEGREESARSPSRDYTVLTWYILNLNSIYTITVVTIYAHILKQRRLLATMMDHDDHHFTIFTFGSCIISALNLNSIMKCAINGLLYVRSGYLQVQSMVKFVYRLHDFKIV